MHHKAGRKLGVKSAHRRAMMANLCSSLIRHRRIETTLTRAKELRRVAERMITLGKRNTLHARRHALRILRDNRAVKMLFDELSPVFMDRMGGYTRILKLGFRRGDSAPMAMIEYLGFEAKHAAKDAGKSPGPAKKAPPKKKPADKAHDAKAAKQSGGRKKAKKQTAAKKPAKKERAESKAPRRQAKKSESA